MIASSKIINRFHRSQQYWEKFNVRDEPLKKKLGYYKIKHINNLVRLCSQLTQKSISSISKMENETKKKGIKKGSSGMEFESFAKIINALSYIEKFGQLKIEKQEIHRFCIKEG